MKKAAGGTDLVAKAAIAQKIRQHAEQKKNRDIEEPRQQAERKKNRAIEEARQQAVRLQKNRDNIEAEARQQAKERKFQRQKRHEPPSRNLSW